MADQKKGSELPIASEISSQDTLFGLRAGVTSQFSASVFIPDVPVFNSYDDVRSFTGSAPRLLITGFDLGGEFEYNPAGADDGFMQIGKYRRVYDGPIRVTWFGAVRGAADQLASFNRAATYAKSVASSAGKSLIYVPEGEWFLSAPTTDDAIWLLHPNSEFSSVGGIAPTFVTDTRMLTGKIFRYGGAKQANTLTVGDSYYTVQRLLGKGVTGEVTGMSRNAAPGVTGVSHSSGSTSNGQSTIGIQGFGVNDNLSVAKHAWGAYVEAFRIAGAQGNASGWESMIYNGGDVKPSNVFLTPRDNSGQTFGGWITTGYNEQTAIPLGKDATGALGISKKGEARFNRGIVFYTDTITSKEAIVMPQDHMMKWVSSSGTGESIIEVATAQLGSSLYNQVSIGGTCAVRGFRRNADGSDTAASTILAITEAYGIAGGAAKMLVQTRAVQTSAMSGGNAGSRFDVQTFTNAGAQILFSIGSAAVQYGTDLAGALGAAAQRFTDVFAQRLRPGAGAVIWTSGTGSPEGVLSAVQGSLYTRTDGGAGQCLYAKESGGATASTTGWVAK